MARDAQDAGHDLLRFGRVLRGGIDDDASGFIEARESALRFEIEVLLATDRELAREAVGTACKGCGGVGAPYPVRAGVERRSGDGVFNGEDWIEGTIFDFDFRSSEAGSFERIGEDPGDGLRVIGDFGWEERFVVAIRAGVCFTGGIGRGEGGDDAGFGESGFDIKAQDERVGVWRHNRPRVEEIGVMGQQVVSVKSRAGDMEVGRFVRDHMDARNFSKRF
jgi:hypothetical protein